jgi:hypothetical protein
MREYDVSRLILTCRHFGKEIFPFLRVSACDAGERDGGCALPVLTSEKTSFRPILGVTLKDCGVPFMGHRARKALPGFDYGANDANTQWTR